MSTSLARWMAELPPDQTALPLRLLKIPGSHNSGASPVLDTKLPIANDSSKYIRTLGKVPCVRRGIKRWAVTQSQSVRRQLDIGIRYLDLRVSYPPSDVRISRKNFRVVHALYGPSIQEVLQQVIEFLEENKKEVVILDMNHFFNMDKSMYRVLQNEVVAVLGKDQICPFMNVNLVSLDFMWKNGYRVVIFSSFPGGNPALFWPAAMISSPWPNTNNVGVLLAFLDSSLERRRYSPHGFFVTQGVCTPKKSDIIRRWPYTLQSSFCQRTNGKMLEWLDKLSKWKQQTVNVVILDFVEIEYSRRIISLNYSAKR